MSEVAEEDARGIDKHDAASTYQLSHEEWQGNLESDEEKCRGRGELSQELIRESSLITV